MAYQHKVLRVDESAECRWEPPRECSVRAEVLEPPVPDSSWGSLGMETMALTMQAVRPLPVGD
jgi:hypothetical protein